MERRIRVFVIDDDSISLFLTRNLIEEHFGQELDIHCFDNPIDALVKLKLEKKNKIDFPDYIYTDLQMPAMSGIEFIAALENSKLDYMRCEIVIMSANEELLVNCTSTLERKYQSLRKPITFANLPR